MAIFHHGIATAAAEDEVVTKSCRWNYDDDAVLTRTFSSAGNERLWTWSGWVKRGKMGSIDTYGVGIFGCDGTSSVSGDHMVNLSFHTDDTLMFDVDKALGDYTVATSAVFRDPAAWYHIVLIYDSDQEDPDDRVRIHVNGVQHALTSSSDGWVPQYYDGRINAEDVVHHIGAYHSTWTTNFYDGYIADVYFIDGAAKAPGDFAAADSNGQWSPIAYDMSSHSGNSFHLPFTDNAGEQVFADSSSTGHTITANGNVRHTRAQKEIDSSSIYFDGTGDYLSVASNAEFGMGTGNFTIEFWVRFSAINSFQWMIGGAGGNYLDVAYYTTGGLTCFFDNATSRQFSWSPSVDTWYHVAVVRSGTDDLDAYIDGTQIGSTLTLSDDIPTQGLGFGRQYNGTYYLDGYLDDIRVVKGTAVYTGNFTKPSSALTAVSGTSLLIHSDWSGGGIGGDSSGNFNDWQAVNLVASDQVNDRPKNNFATLNPLDNLNGSALSEGNLKVVGSATQEHLGATWNMPSSKKWYWEVYQNDTTGIELGITYNRLELYDYGVGVYDTYVRSLNTEVTASSGIAAGDIVQFAVDSDSGEVWVGKNDTWWAADGDTDGNPSNGTNPTAEIITPAIEEWQIQAWAVASGATRVFNFGQDPTFAGNKTSGQATSEFFYAPPDGFKALSTANLPTPTIKKGNEHFDTLLYTSSGEQDGLSFQPNLVWIKSRQSANEHELTDSVRTATKALSSDSSNVESTDSTGLTSFDSDGFTVGADSNYSDTGAGMVAWSWKKSATAGMDIVTWTGNSTSTGVEQTVPHGLNAAPDFAIFKAREADGAYSTQNWYVYHKNLSANKYLTLDTTDAETDHDTTDSLWVPGNWDNETIEVGNDSYSLYLNYDETDYVGYLFSEVAGHSRFTEFTGASGAFCWLGFRPALLILKSASSGGWYMFDSKREGYNADNDRLYADATTEEDTTDHVDLLSNGFKIQSSSFDLTSGTVLVMAWGESPFKYSSAR